MSRAANLIKSAKERLTAELTKEAFTPTGDPAAGGAPPAGAPPMDPGMAGGGMPPAGAPPMDPGMAGGAPPGMDPAAAAAAPGPPIQVGLQDLVQFMQMYGGGGAEAAAGGAPGGAPGAAPGGKKGGTDQKLDEISQKLDELLGIFMGLLQPEGAIPGDGTAPAGGAPAGGLGEPPMPIGAGTAGPAPEAALMAPPAGAPPEAAAPPTPAAPPMQVQASAQKPVSNDRVQQIVARLRRR
jgi:hypothetical protein